jgi:hypothetical protein
VSSSRGQQWIGLEFVEQSRGGIRDFPSGLLYSHGFDLKKKIKTGFPGWGMQS